jgi:hypothetical protein
LYIHSAIDAARLHASIHREKTLAQIKQNRRDLGMDLPFSSERREMEVKRQRELERDLEMYRQREVERERAEREARRRERARARARES